MPGFCRMAPVGLVAVGAISPALVAPGLAAGVPIQNPSLHDGVRASSLDALRAMKSGNFNGSLRDRDAASSDGGDKASGVSI